MDVRRKTIGILGGMGPESTADLFSLIVKHTPAQKDQDHIRIIIDNNPQIPGRVEAISGNGPSPLKEMERSIRNLEACHVDLICIPCNVVHYYYDDLQRMTAIPITHLIEECAKYTSQNLPHLRKVGLLAARPTVESGLYHRSFEKIGVEVLAPDRESQDKVTKCIYGKNGIKAGYIDRNRRTLSNIANEMIASGAEAVIAGCTEVGLGMRRLKHVTVIDPIDILARVVVEKCASSGEQRNRDGGSSPMQRPVTGYLNDQRS
jgi:aspartate racemase